MDNDTELALMKKDIDYIKKTLDKVVLSLEVADEKADKKYAGKWVERAMVAIISLVLTSVVGALVALVINKPNVALALNKSSVAKRLEYPVSLIIK